MTNPQSLNRAWRKCKSRTRAVQLETSDMSGWQLYLKRLNRELETRGKPALTGSQLARAYDAYRLGHTAQDAANMIERN
jgi:hypothetical protein